MWQYGPPCTCDRTACQVVRQHYLPGCQAGPVPQCLSLPHLLTSPPHIILSQCPLALTSHTILSYIITLAHDSRFSHRYQPEILDALCFPSSLQPQDTPTAGPSSKKAPAPPFSSLDGLLQLLKQAPQLLAGQPKLLAGVMRVLLVLWENQAAAHGAVELLRAQPELWQGLKVRPDACMLLSCAKRCHYCACT
jgi:hypothetical protein